MKKSHSMTNSQKRGLIDRHQMGYAKHVASEMHGLNEPLHIREGKQKIAKRSLGRGILAGAAGGAAIGAATTPGERGFGAVGGAVIGGVAGLYGGGIHAAVKIHKKYGAAEKKKNKAFEAKHLAKAEALRKQLGVGGKPLGDSRVAKHVLNPYFRVGHRLRKGM